MNVVDRVVEVHRGPTRDRWAPITRHERGETISPEAFPDLLVRIAEVLR